MDKDYIKKIITEFLNKKEEITFAYLFGSFIQKKDYHDVDIAEYLE